MQIAEIVSFLETLAPPALQESYDNAGLLAGNPAWECRGIICALDSPEEIIDEAIANGCNLVVAHHPIIFGGLKKINPDHYVGRTIIKAIKHDIAIYAIHTNLDNVIAGVNGRMAERIGLTNISTLSARPGTLRKLFCFVPIAHADKVRTAIFDAGAGSIGNYSECSFSSPGEGSFKAGDGANPFVGKPGERHIEPELKLEAIFPAHLENKIIRAMKEAHPYEEVAFDIVSLANPQPGIGSGLIGELQKPASANDFIQHLKFVFGLEIIRHSKLDNKLIKKVAVCGGAGSFLIAKALAAKADAFITADLKYHEFFEADGRLLLMDIGHFESEQFTIDLLQEVLGKKFLTFAVLKTAVSTNPVRYS